MNYHSALQTCNGHSGTSGRAKLAEPMSNAEFNFLVGKYGGWPDKWLGIHDQGHEGR